MEEINLSNQQLTEIPKWVFDNPQVRVLNLEGNQLTSLPPNIGQLTNLTKLSLAFNRLTFLPPEIGQLTHLTKLSLRCNQLTVLPPEIGQLTRLITLDLGYNQLTSLPPEIGQLTRLTILDLECNQLTSLPSEIGQLTHLTILSLTGSQLTSLPPEIWQLTHLTELYLTGNQLTSLPHDIGQLTQLTELDLGYNLLTSLPPEIGQLTHLTELDLEDNRLTSLPPEIGQLTQLTELYLGGNRLTSLQVAICNLRNAKIYYSRNPITYLPPQVERFLQRQQVGQKLYSDPQSVHNTDIQRAFRQSVEKLSETKPVLTTDETLTEVLASNLCSQTKQALTEYCSDTTVHSVLNLTFSEILQMVWNRIRNHPVQSEILTVLDQEMSDALCQCFTGRITRLVNCLNIFDPDVQFTISDAEQLSNLVILIRGKFSSLPEQRLQLEKEMKERGYPPEKIQEWTGYLE